MPETETMPARLQSALINEIARIAATVDGRVGVAAWPAGRVDQAVLFHADETFPMGSTMKLPASAAALGLVDEGLISLETLVDIPLDIMLPNPVMAGVAEYFVHPGLALSVANLIEVAITNSDNTTTDVLMAHIGGPDAINAWLGRKHIVGQRVDRSFADLIRDFFAMDAGPVMPQYQRAMAALTKDTVTVKTTNLDWERDERDTTTPRAMADLIDAIWSGGALSPSCRNLLIGSMSRCRTGLNRLPAQLPKGTALYHKTGGVGGMTADLGVISLPDGAGDIVIVVYVSESFAEIAERERAIATIGRAIYDFYLLAG